MREPSQRDLYLQSWGGIWHFFGHSFEEVVLLTWWMDSILPQSAWLLNLLAIEMIKLWSCGHNYLCPNCNFQKRWITHGRVVNQLSIRLYCVLFMRKVNSFVMHLKDIHPGMSSHAINFETPITDTKCMSGSPSRPFKWQILQQCC